ncbi:IS3 family transposase [Nicoliella spurrieriana]|uniref:IS3 family transposase n=1 Tax=Nicoliella spurrieriana TaxID=2925830 RepID=UPI003C6E612A
MLLRCQRAPIYYWFNYKPTARYQQNIILKRDILVAWKQSRYVYGYPRIHQILLNQSLKVSSRTV